MNPKVDEFLNNATQWQNEMRLLRSIALACGLTEEMKWKQPCYTFQGRNILIVSSFKEYAVMAFFKGVLLRDEKKILISPGENSHHVRQIRIQSEEEIQELQSLIKTNIFEAIELEKQGLKVETRVVSDYDTPEELSIKFEESPELKEAFDALTPGRQKGYLLFFSQAKQSSTRFARIEKYTSRILKGQGMNDCVCGHSKRMPSCDGSHKYFE